MDAAAAAVAAAADRALKDTVRRFTFAEFNPRVDEWRYYIDRFELALQKYDLLEGEAAAPHRRNLLLTSVGAEAYRVVADHFRPEAANVQTYVDIKAALKAYYEQKICTLAERVVFTQRHRKDTETITQYLNALRALAGNCGFGANLNERLRDQLVIGINSEQWQKELFRLHPRDDATLADVSSSALLLEQASTQQQRLHHLTKGGSSGSADTPV